MLTKYAGIMGIGGALHLNEIKLYVYCVCCVYKVTIQIKVTRIINRRIQIVFMSNRIHIMYCSDSQLVGREGPLSGSLSICQTLINWKEARL